MVLPSGNQYKVLKAGGGKHHPVGNSNCHFHVDARCGPLWTLTRQPANPGKAFSHRPNRRSRAQNWPDGGAFETTYLPKKKVSKGPPATQQSFLREALKMMVEGPLPLPPLPPLPAVPVSRLGWCGDSGLPTGRRQMGAVRACREQGVHQRRTPPWD